MSKADMPKMIIHYTNTDHYYVRNEQSTAKVDEATRLLDNVGTRMTMATDNSEFIKVES